MTDDKKPPIYRLDLNYGRHPDASIEDVTKMVITREFLFLLANLADLSQALIWYELLPSIDSKTGSPSF